MSAQRWAEGMVVSQRHWTDTLLSLQVMAEVAEFEAGQFTRLSLDIGGEVITRPYSFVNAPGERPLEFYYGIVPGGPLSPALARLAAGDRILVATAPAGFLVLSEVPDADTLWLLATGTGIGPFLSMLGTETPWRRFRRVVLVHAARLARELAYRDKLAALASRHGERLRVVHMLSREPAADVLTGRIPQAIADGRLERAAGLALDAAGAQVLLCGNPGMVTETTAVLRARGMQKHRRRQPGQISAESYW
ncbi:MAG: ferredoxin--NADP reductase [Betaproteobacteria bacterium]|nr:ferredoxin--NADP reductase [Betaproteobacteria bacterium]